MTEETPCQRLVRTTANIKRFTTTRDGYKQILTSLESDANHDPTNAKKIQKEYEEISALLENGVSDFGSLPRCTTIGCPLHTLTHQVNFHLALLHTQKKRNNEGFISPTQTAKRVILENPSFQINLKNRFSLPTTINSSEFPVLPTSQQTTAQQNAQAGGTTSSSTAANMNTTQTGVTPSLEKPGLTNTSTQGVQPRVTPSSTQNNTPKVPLPPPVMLLITKHYREQLKTLTMVFPNLRTKTTGEFLKLYTNNHEECSYSTNSTFLEYIVRYYPKPTRNENGNRFKDKMHLSPPQSRPATPNSNVMTEENANGLYGQLLISNV
ncbi:hypothetical protein TNCV_4582301 [Trichonephila clavipes]|nr:hypothetical protein TNCV_4582301 [Trichonephila clavipes]